MSSSEVKTKAKAPPGSDDGKPDTKRAKAGTALTDVISSTVMQDTKELQASYKSVKPYPHLVLQDVFHADFLEKVREEIKDHSKVNFKESDLFRVYQSIDLANLSSDTGTKPPPAAASTESTAKDEKGKDADKGDGVESETGPNMPAVMQLREVLYSEEWRNFVETLCGLDAGTLTKQTDCACNCHTAGCHLLCHDDVIGTRKVSYIIYLTDEPPSWTPEEGGALELYDSKPAPDTNASKSTNGKAKEGEGVEEAAGQNGHRIPDSVPCKTVLPAFNSMAMFVVEPGYSFHAVQEVYGDRPRLSLQGWYHASDPPKNIHQATLQQLKKSKSPSAAAAADAVAAAAVKLVAQEAAEEAEEGKTKASAAGTKAGESANEGLDEDDSDDKPPTLSVEDKAYLSKYIHETYLTQEAMNEIRDKFEEDSSVQLRKLLREPWISRIQTIMQDAEKESIPMMSSKVEHDAFYKQGESHNWKIVGPSHMQRYLEYVPEKNSEDNDEVDIDKINSMGGVMFHLRSKLLNSKPFYRYLACITSLGLPLSCDGNIRRFRRGLDYTVAHYGLLRDASILDATLCFVAGKGEEVLELPDSDDNDEDDDNGQKKYKKTESSSGTAKESEGKDKKVSGASGGRARVDRPRYDEADIAWQSGDYGAFECYIAADDEDDEEAAAEYNEDDDTELLSVSASNNTLSLVYRDPGTMRFVKYVSSRAPSSRFDIAMEYEVEDDDEPDDDEGQRSDEEDDED